MHGLSEIRSLKSREHKAKQKGIESSADGLVEQELYDGVRDGEFRLEGIRFLFAVKFFLDILRCSFEGRRSRNQMCRGEALLKESLP